MKLFCLAAFVFLASVNGPAAAQSTPLVAPVTLPGIPIPLLVPAPDGGAQALGSCVIGGRVFVDTNQNHVYDPGEPGLAGWTVRIRRKGSFFPLRVTTTDSNGFFLFNGSFSAPTKYVLVAWKAGVPTQGKRLIKSIPMVCLAADVPVPPQLTAPVGPWFD